MNRVARITTLIISMSVKPSSQNSLQLNLLQPPFLPNTSHRWAGDLEPANICVGPCHMPVHCSHQFGPHHLHLCCEKLWEIFSQHLQHYAAQDLRRKGVKKKLNLHGQWYENDMGTERVKVWENVAIKIMAGGSKRELHREIDPVGKVREEQWKNKEFNSL